jgi:hypothetical protein
VLYYSAYSLRIRSEIPLLELPTAEQGGDVDIQVREAERLDEAQSIEWRAKPYPVARFSYPSAGRFDVCGGRRVIVTPAPEAESALLRLYVQGMMLAAVLHQRGYFVLHSSIVSLGGRCIAFVGSVGAGKSTLASAFHARGYAVMADDNAALDLSQSPLKVLPAFPSLKIYPEVAAALGYDRSGLRPVHRSQGKHAQSVADGFTSGPLPLDAIYVLDRDAASEVGRLSTVETITELIRHSVPTRWGVGGDGTHLQMCARLASTVPAYRVRTFHELQEIREVVGRVLTHYERAKQ